MKRHSVEGFGALGVALVVGRLPVAEKECGDRHVERPGDAPERADRRARQPSLDLGDQALGEVRRRGDGLQRQLALES